MTELDRTINLGDKSVYLEQAHNVYFSYGEKKIKKLLGVVPIYPEIFIGRDADIEVIHKKLSKGQNSLLLVNGEGGIGKTTVASTYYHKYIEKYSHLIWIAAEKSIEDALLPLALELQLKFDDNISAEQKIDDILRELIMLGKPSLLVIDNANDLIDLNNLYPRLRKCTTLHLLITTRVTECAHAETYPIKHLDEMDARELFVRLYHNHDSSENEILNQILMAVGYNTLVIEMLAKNLNNFNNILRKEYTLDALLEDLQQKGVLCLGKSEAVSTDYKLQTAKPEAIVEAMYDISGLKDEEKALLSVFAVLPAVNIPFNNIKALFHDLDGLEKLLLSIAQKGWIDLDKKLKSFKCSPVIQEIVRKQNLEKLAENCQVLVDNLVVQLDYEPGTGNITKVSYEEAVIYVQYSEMVCSHLFELRGDISILLDSIGTFYKTYGNLDKALKYFDDETVLFEELYESNPQNVGFKNGLAISYSKLGVFFRDNKNDKHAAHGYFHNAERLWKSLSQDNPAYVEFRKNWVWINNTLDNL